MKTSLALVLLLAAGVPPAVAQECHDASEDAQPRAAAAAPAAAPAARRPRARRPR